MRDWTQEQRAALYRLLTGTRCSYRTVAEALPSCSEIYRQLRLRFPREAEGISPTDVAVKVLETECSSDPGELDVLAGVGKIWTREQCAALDAILVEACPYPFHLHQQLRDKFPEVSAPISARDLEVKINEIEEAQTQTRNQPKALSFMDAAKVVLLGLN